MSGKLFNLVATVAVAVGVCLYVGGQGKATADPRPVSKSDQVSLEQVRDIIKQELAGVKFEAAPSAPKGLTVEEVQQAIREAIAAQKQEQVEAKPAVKAPEVSSVPQASAGYYRTVRSGMFGRRTQTVWVQQ